MLKKKKIFHVINLSTYGGVERLFPLVLEAHVKKFPHHEHHLMLERSRIHPLVKEKISPFITSHHSFRSFYKIPIPRRMRDFYKSWLFRHAEGSHTVFWNTFSHQNLIHAITSRGGTYSYYDHGNSWVHPVNESTKSFFQQAKSILACSKSSRKMIELKWGFKEKLETIPLGVEIKNVVVGKTFDPSLPIRLGVAGRLHPVKGYCLVIHAASILKARGVPFELFVAGTGIEEPNLKKLSLDLNLGPKVQFLGLVSDMSRFFKNIHLLLSPSIREAFGLSCLEAALSGCPIIASSIDGFSEVILKGKSGICLKPTLPLSDYEKLGGNPNGLPDCVFDPEEDRLVEPKLVSPIHLADAIESFVKEPSLLKEMSVSAIEQAKNYSEEAYLNKINDYLLKMVS